MGVVLIVDDEANVRRVLELAVARSGHDVETAADAESGFAAVVKSKPDVVLCDLHMPGANGLWLIDRIREVAPTTAVVLATGDSTVPPRESFRPGIVAYVLKPFDRQQVLRAIREGMAWSAHRSKEALRRTRSA